MEPTSAEQVAALAAGRVPEPERVRDDVWSIPIPMPTAYVPYTLTCVIRGGDGGLHVIDPGLDSDENWQALERGFARFGLDLRDVASATSTHAHPDHLGLAGRLRATSSATVVMHRLDAESLAHPHRDRSAEAVAARLASWGAPAEEAANFHEPERKLGVPSLGGFVVDRTVEDGDLLDIAGRHIAVLHTPGHTAGSICLRDAEAGLLFTGDHVLPTINPGIGLGGTHDGNPLAGYLAGLERVAVFAADEVWPGHFYRFTGIAERSEELARHQLKRAAEVRAVLDREPDADVWQIAQRLTWTGGWDSLKDFMRISALLQTEMFVEYVS